MAKSRRFPVGFPPAIGEIIKQQVGILGNSEAEVVKNMILIYMTEKGIPVHIHSSSTHSKLHSSNFPKYINSRHHRGWRLY